MQLDAHPVGHSGNSFTSRKENKALTRLLRAVVPSLAVLLHQLERCDQEKHRASRFVLPYGMRVQQFLRWLRF